MSVEAMGQVWPHVGDFPPRQSVILLAIADVVNDANDNLFWMPADTLAEKAGASRSTAYSALLRFVDAGWLEVVSEASGRRAAEYRWVGPPACVQVSDTELVSETDDVVSSPAPLVSETAISLLSTNANEPKDPTRGRRAFADTWEHYPRKLNRKGAEKAWTAQVRKGSDPDLMHTATLNYASLRHGQDPTTTMHGATFYGPNDRWTDYVNPTPDAAVMPRPRESAQMSKARRALEAVARTDIERDAIALMVGEAS